MRQLLPALFQARHFDRSIILLCVRRYITYKLSYRDLVEMMAERIVEFDVEEVVETRGALPLRWRFVEYSPFNPVRP